MDGNLYEQLYQLVLTVEHPDSAGVVHSDRTIVLFLYRASADKLSLLQVCQPGHWVGLTPPASRPSQPTLSRRSRSASVQALLKRVEDRLRKLDLPAEGPEVAILDGHAFDVSGHSRDPDAKLGRGTGRFEKGYKAHILWGSGCLPLSWRVTPMNTAECRTALELLAALPRVEGRPAFVLGDSAYDANYLYAAARERGWQLLAPGKNPGAGLGHCRHDPARLAGRELLQQPEGKALFAQRTGIERHFSAWGTRPEGLNELPKHVRRLNRVRLQITLSLHLNAVRILMNKKSLQPLRSE
jgi:hypothetical protein